MDDQIIKRRLTLIKYLYNQGVEQSKKAETIAGFSLMQFHDAVEMFLLLVAENLGIHNYQKWSFMQYWQEISTLTMGSQMESMKNRRVSLKHHAAFPSHDDVDECRINVGAFLTENAKIQFNIEFSDISLIDLISFEGTRKYLKVAQEKLKSDDYSRGDRFLSHSSRHTQVPVPVTTCIFFLILKGFVLQISFSSVRVYIRCLILRQLREEVQWIIV